jgi:hypothetical protein
MRPHDFGVILVVSLWSPIQGLEKERLDNKNVDNNTAAVAALSRRATGLVKSPDMI